MIETLRDAIRGLHYPLLNRGNWESMFIDYETPHVERIWVTMNLSGNDVRVCLHKIHPCKKEEAFFHPHPWPSAMLICSGAYESYIGYSENGKTPEKMGPFLFQTGTVYQMTNPKEWHSVRPIDVPCMTIMVTGKPYQESTGQKKNIKNRPLTKKEFDGVFNYFSDISVRNSLLTVLDNWK